MTRGILLAVLAFAGICSAAFKSEQWLARRDDDADVLRLRKAYASCVSKLENPAENVVLPLEQYEDGTVKSRLTAGRANIFEDSSFVWAKDLLIEQFDPKGERTASLEAEQCVVDRATKSGWVEGRAAMSYKDTTICGRGVYFSLPDEFFKVLSQSEIRTKRGAVTPRSIVK